MDCIHGQLFTGHRFKMLPVVDSYRKICPAIGIGTTYRGRDGVQALEHATQEYGIPQCLRVDNGPEFISRE